MKQAEKLTLDTESRVAGAVVRFSTLHHGMTDPSEEILELDGRLVRIVEVLATDPIRKTKSHAPLAQPAQLLRFTPGQLHVLLGRNGSGKTRFLQGLLRALDPHESYPAVSLMVELPDDSAGEEAWGDISSGLSVEAQLAAALQPSPDTTYLEPDGIAAFGLPAQDVLNFFGFSDGEIKNWANRGARFEGFDIELGGDDTTWPSWSIRDHSPELLLLGVRQLPHNRGDAESNDRPWEDPILPAGVWFNDPSLRDLVRPALDEFLKIATCLEVIDGSHARLLAPRPDHGALKILLSHGEAAIADASRSSRLPFPLGLVEPLDLSGIPFVASFPFPFTVKDLIEVVDISPHSENPGHLNEVVHSLTRTLVQFRMAESEHGASFQIDGLRRLRDTIAEVANVLKRCEIGIADLGIEWPPNDGNRWAKAGDSEWLCSGIPSLVPSLLWTDGSSGIKLRPEQASEGQQHVMALFLQLAEIRARRSMRPRLSQDKTRHTILVGDEIDRFLHPSASTQVLGELANALVDLPRVTCLVSTHNVASLSGPVLRSTARLFARRGPEGFHYSSASDCSLDEMKDILGATFLDALNLKRLFLLVEGTMDVLVIEAVLKAQIPELPDIHIVNPHGLYGWDGIIANLLRFVDAPVLLIHDKRNPELEEQWSRCQVTLRNSGRLPSWSHSKLQPFLDGIYDRKRKNEYRPGDTELEKILWLLKNNCFDPVFRNQRNPAERIHLFGLECEDIVDLLPIRLFPELNGFRSWQEAHQDFRDKNERSDGKAFKNAYGIKEQTVKAAIAKNHDSVHQELARLLNTVRTLLAS